MADTCIWTGGSGKTYTYFIHDIDWSVNADQDGNYIFAKVVNDVWNAVYVGEGDLQTRKAAHINDGCVTDKGATHFHEHLNAGEQARKDEEEDILEGNPGAYVPTGCNEKEGG